jgi:hypothetical protein
LIGTSLGKVLWAFCAIMNTLADLAFIGTDTRLRGHDGKEAWV